MKNNFLNKLGLFFLAASISFSTLSCEDLIEQDPAQSIDAEGALTSSKENLSAAIVGIYAPLKSTTNYGNRLITLPEALSDNGRATNHSGRLVNEARNLRGAHFTHYSNNYSAINRANLVLAAIPNMKDPSVTDANKAAWTGEVKFLRALYYFDLVRAYAYIPGAIVDAKNKGGVPLILEPIKSTEEVLVYKPKRASIDEVYDQIYTDLNDAIAKLGSMTSTSRPNVASKQAAQALLSRVALYRKDWAKVIEMSSAVITARGTTLLNKDNYLNGWSTAINPESLFEVEFRNTNENIGVNESLQTTFTTMTIRGTRTTAVGFGDLVPTDPLIAALGVTPVRNTSGTLTGATYGADVRGRLFEAGGTGRSSVNIETTKFLGKNGSVNLDNVPVLRIAEMYLNRAEAYSESGQDALALADVNTLRVSRGLTASVGVTGDALKTEIMLQRRLEFAFEGHRFFDLKRKGLDILKPAQPGAPTILFTADVILPAIPTSETDGNPDFLQNFGY
ncbi:RagB/SusD family nutrient uptake outer membrane protein [Rufibacter soli]|jgi:starch-binding outer membrane protein, SusD/RagB family